MIEQQTAEFASLVDTMVERGIGAGLGCPREVAKLWRSYLMSIPTKWPFCNRPEKQESEICDPRKTCRRWIDPAQQRDRAGGANRPRTPRGSGQ